MTQTTRSRQCKKLSKLKKTCVKKSKVTKQISTRAFIKKNYYMKYYQHNYADNAEITMVDLVNDDCLAEIFMYLPALERPKVASVCKKWKNALEYSWRDVKKLKLTHWEYDKCPSYLKKYPKYIGQLRFLKSLLHNCGYYLTELDLTAYGHWNIVRVINESCPNLVKLELRFKYPEPKLLSNAFSRLSKLEVLKIIFQNIDNNYGYLPSTLINSLRSVAGTLTKLTLSNWNTDIFFNRCKIPKSFTRVIPKLKALKLIETIGIRIDTNLSKQLEQLGISIISHDNQPVNQNNFCTYVYNNITGINLYDYKAVTDDCLYTIANCLKLLKKLRILCHQVTDAGIVAISKMNNLKILILRGRNYVTGSSIELLKNLEVLRLPYSNKIITDDSVTKILKNSPGMKWFCIMESAITSEFIKKAAQVATKRKKKLELSLSDIPDIKQYESPYLHLILYDSLNNIVYESNNIINN